MLGILVNQVLRATHRRTILNMRVIAIPVEIAVSDVVKVKQTFSHAIGSFVVLEPVGEDLPVCDLVIILELGV